MKTNLEVTIRQVTTYRQSFGGEMRFVAIALWLGAFPSIAFAHHSVAALYDYSDVREMEGTITAIDWINPHIRLTMEAATANGEQETWELEASALNVLQRNGVTADLLHVGDRVTVIGPVSRDGRNAMIAAVAVLANGDRVPLFALIASRVGLEVPTQGQAFLPPQIDSAERSSDQAHGIFRVWTPRGRPTTGEGSHVWPLTVAARAVVDAYDPLVDDPALACIPAGMPVILDTPLPVEFREVENDIVMRFEEWDGVRTIHMAAGEQLQEPPPSPMGYSVGRWVENTLEVATAGINYPYFDDLGTPQGETVEVAERFTLSAVERRLDWTATITDRETLTEPVVLEGYMTWIPGEQVKPYNCTL